MEDTRWVAIHLRHGLHDLAAPACTADAVPSAEAVARAKRALRKGDRAARSVSDCRSGLIKHVASQTRPLALTSGVQPLPRRTAKKYFSHASLVVDPD